MFAAISVLIIIICILLILIVLVQNSKGGGLAANFTGSQVMGVRKTADFLEKASWTLAASVLFLCILANIVIPRQTETQQKSVIQEQVQQSKDPNEAIKFPTSVPEKKEAPAAAPQKEEKKK